ncbi:MAG: hypothetical protein IJC36_00040 [Clostridia bacterium]|nr:hypothetical protein [Clostridia bacterium]
MANITIKNTVPVQENFLGNGAIYHGFASMPDSLGRNYSDELCDTEADRVANMKLKIARTFYGAYAWEPDTKTWNWENERMQGFYAWLQRMKERNITVAINIGWWSGSDLTGDSGSTYGALMSDTIEESLIKYGDWVSESIHQIVEVHGFTNVKIVVIFTEPQHDYNLWLEELKAAHNALKRDNRRHLVKLMGPNEAGEGVAKMVKWAAENAFEYLDIYSSHYYQLAADLPQKFKRTGICSPMAKVPGGRVVQTVKLEKNTNYTMKMVAALQSTDLLHVSGNILFGAFDTSFSCVLAGGQPTSRISLNSVKMLDPAEMTEEYKEYSFTFNSGEHDEAFVCFFYDVKRQQMSDRLFNGIGFPECELYVDSMHLYKEGTNVNVIRNPQFEDGYEHWMCQSAGGQTDAYYDWYQWGKNGVNNTPVGKPYIFDEYNTLFSRDNSRSEHGVQICNAAVALMNSGVAGSLLWSLFDQQWPNSNHSNDDSFVAGDHRCGTAPTLTRSLIPYKSFYAFSLLSRYTGGEGSKVYEGFGENNINCTMNVMPDGNVTIVVVNSKDTDDEFELKFENPLDLNLYKYRFDPNTIICDETAKPIVHSGCDIAQEIIKGKIPAYGMLVYTTYAD